MSARLPFESPQRGRPLVPESLPWLVHTSVWPLFSHAERVRANQLMGLVVNELSLVVEEDLIIAGLHGLSASAVLRGEPALRRRLHAMLADEHRHAGWFTAYNRAFAPELYQHDGWHFLRPRPLVRSVSRIALSLPGSWRMCLWLVAATEEWSCAYAEVLREAPVGPLGPRDDAYVLLHAAHRREELRHVALDLDLLEFARGRTWSALRPRFAASAQIALAEFMRPRRAARSMVRRFICEFPRWRGHVDLLERELRAIGSDEGYWRSVGVARRVDGTAACAAAWGGPRWDAQVSHA